MLRALQSIARAPLTGTLNVLRPSSSVLIQKSFDSSDSSSSFQPSSWFSEVKPAEKETKPHEKYDAYPSFDHYTPSPYKNDYGVRKFYETKIHRSGVLPRPEGSWEDKPLPMPVYELENHNAWVEKKSLFGQNDYIDILGDGSVHPWELVKAPGWIKGFKGNELMRLIRRLALQGDFLKENFPTLHHSIVKQVRYLYLKLNKRKRNTRWGGYRRFSRIDKPRERY